ncbi:MAG: chorismate synthase [Alphaproteobacteria bacterium]|nr:chorismate synthase [Alphaproteobacteria bacterium]
MSSNTFGTLFKYTTWGESHGIAIGCVVDGAPPRLDLSEEYIQQFLDKRKPGQSRHTTARQEEDRVKILSGVFEGKTTGTPISLMIENTDARSGDYGDIKDKYRPGHADFTYDQKYGIRDYRGGGRASARETACRVAAGAVARLILKDVQIEGSVIQIGSYKADERHLWEKFLDQLREQGSSTGAVVEVIARGVPVGLGAPVADKLDADIAKAMMSINAVKGVEIGDGFAAAELTGEVNADQIQIKEGKPHFLSNHSGGILGGISTGQDIIVRLAFKPTSSILQSLQTIDTQDHETEIVTKGRHDPCVGLRGAPVAEAMLAIVLADHWLRHKAQCG